MAGTQHSELASLRATRAVLDDFGLFAKHALGQNFLVDDNVVGKILELAGLSALAAADARMPAVLEVGPGIGTLTAALLGHAYVIAVERDASLARVLAETTALHSERFALIEGDALKLVQRQIDDARSRIHAPVPRALVANLPYGVAATLVLGWFQRFAFLDSATVMVQSEVADRIMAHPGTKNYGAYTVKLRMYARPAGRFQVSPSCFYPAPHVESAVIRLERGAPLASERVLRAACTAADAAFALRRKNIRNSMKSAFDAETVDALLSACGIDPKTRGETLAFEDYLRLGEALAKRT